MKKYKELFTPIKIGKMELKNRTIFPPISTNFAAADGHLTEKFMQHYERRAVGGVALIIIENVCIDFPQARHGKFEPRFDSSDFLPDWQELVRRVHKHTVKISVELTHDGYKEKTVNEFSAGKIEEILKKYVNAAEIAFKAGFDFVEIQAAHGLLPNKFLSPLTNQRNDKWGKRTVFAVEIRRRIGEKLGFEFPVTIRLAVDDFKANGIDLAEGKRIAEILAAAGYDMIQADVGLGPKEKRLEPMAYEEGWRSYLAKAIKPLPVPVAAVGVIRSPEIAEKILKEEAELVVLGRTLIADPDWVNKVENGEENLLRKCIGCSECIKARHDENVAIRCGVNANVGNEKEIQNTGEPKTIAVVGCGPAGLEATRISALRGHNVHLFCENFGGQLYIGSVPPGKKKIEWLIEFYRNSLAKMDNLHLHYGEYSQKDVAAINPQAVIIATGSKPIVPKWLKNEENVFSYADILAKKVSLENKKIVVGGGGLVGCETALFLAQNNEVTIIEMLPDVGLGMETLSRNHLLGELKEKNVEILTHKKIEQINGGVIIVSDVEDFQKKKIKFDIFVAAFGNKTFVPFRFEKVPHYIIGDAATVRKIVDAVSEGYRVATEL